MERTLLLLCYGMLSMLPFSSAVITCRLACRHCREHNAHPDILEVYCAMCDECKERRREWLQGPPNLHLRNDNDDSRYTNNEHQDTPDDCTTTTTDDHCDEPVLLSKKVTTTTTTSTTHRPSTAKPECVQTTTNPPCLTMPCPVVAPMAIPLCPMFPMMGAMTTAPSSSIAPPSPHIQARKAVSAATTTESMYFYVGVPKRILKDLNNK